MSSRYPIYTRTKRRIYTFSSVTISIGALIACYGIFFIRLDVILFGLSLLGFGSCLTVLDMKYSQEKNQEDGEDSEGEV